MRTEKDFLGQLEIPDDALYGIHSLRAQENFYNTTTFPMEWYRAIGYVKLACYHSYKSYKEAALSTYTQEDLPMEFMDDSILKALQDAAEEIIQNKHFNHFIIPAIQGGAGTSINLNINEIIANSALLKLGKKAGDYKIIDPIEQANIFQSTNDVVPTALKIALMKLLKELEDKINESRKTLEQLENKYRQTPRLAYTQLQEAVPSTYGRLFSTYAEALGRDWWRVSKGWERIKTVNLGGGAIGSGIATARYFIMEVVKKLKEITALPLARAENMGDATSNLDGLVEVSAIIKAHAVNLEKMTNDLRLLASDISKAHLHLPKKQVGSSIMPAKINPVIVEFVISSCQKVYSNDQLITSLAAKGHLELNAYIPTIGYAFIENLKLLIATNISLNKHLLSGIEIDEKAAKKDFYSSPSITTALTPLIGYHKSAELAKLMIIKEIDIYQANAELQYLNSKKLERLMEMEQLMQLGFSLKDLL